MQHRGRDVAAAAAGTAPGAEQQWAAFAAAAAAGAPMRDIVHGSVAWALHLLSRDAAVRRDVAAWRLVHACWVHSAGREAFGAVKSGGLGALLGVMRAAAVELIVAPPAPAAGGGGGDGEESSALWRIVALLGEVANPRGGGGEEAEEGASAASAISVALLAPLVRDTLIAVLGGGADSIVQARSGVGGAGTGEGLPAASAPLSSSSAALALATCCVRALHSTARRSANARAVFNVLVDELLWPLLAVRDAAVGAGADGGAPAGAAPLLRAVDEALSGGLFDASFVGQYDGAFTAPATAAGGAVPSGEARQAKARVLSFQRRLFDTLGSLVAAAAAGDGGSGGAAKSAVALRALPALLDAYVTCRRGAVAERDVSGGGGGGGTAAASHHGRGDPEFAFFRECVGVAGGCAGAAASAGYWWCVCGLLEVLERHDVYRVPDDVAPHPKLSALADLSGAAAGAVGDARDVGVLTSAAAALGALSHLNPALVDPRRVHAAVARASARCADAAGAARTAGRWVREVIEQYAALRQLDSALQSCVDALDALVDADAADAGTTSALRVLTRTWCEDTATARALDVAVRSCPSGMVVPVWALLAGAMERRATAAVASEGAFVVLAGLMRLLVRVSRAVVVDVYNAAPFVSATRAACAGVLAPLLCALAAGGDTAWRDELTLCALELSTACIEIFLVADGTARGPLRDVSAPVLRLAEATFGPLGVDCSVRLKDLLERTAASPAVRAQPRFLQWAAQRLRLAHSDYVNAGSVEAREWCARLGELVFDGLTVGTEEATLVAVDVAAVAVTYVEDGVARLAAVLHRKSSKHEECSGGGMPPGARVALLSDASLYEIDGLSDICALSRAFLVLVFLRGRALSHSRSLSLSLAQFGLYSYQARACLCAQWVPTRRRRLRRN